MSESRFCAIFDISFSLFCRKSVQSWMRIFWAKKCRRDHLRSLWRSVVPVMVCRWQRSAAAEGRWGSLTSVGLRRLWRSVMAMMVRPAGSSWRSEKWSQYPDSKSWSILKRDPRQTVVLMTVRHTCRRGEWRKQHKNWTNYGTTESTTARHDHDGPSRGPSTQPRFGRFPVIRILV